MEIAELIQDAGNASNTTKPTTPVITDPITIEPVKTNSPSSSSPTPMPSIQTIFPTETPLTSIILPITPTPTQSPTLMPSPIATDAPRTNSPATPVPSIIPTDSPTTTIVPSGPPGVTLPATRPTGRPTPSNTAKGDTFFPTIQTNTTPSPDSILNKEQVPEQPVVGSVLVSVNPSSTPTPLDMPPKLFANTPSTTALSSDGSNSVYATLSSIAVAVIISGLLIVAVIWRKKHLQKLKSQDEIVILHDATFTSEKQSSRIASDEALMSLPTHPTMISTPVETSCVYYCEESRIHETTRSQLMYFVSSSQSEDTGFIPPSIRSFGAFDDATRGSYESRSPQGSQLSPGWESVADNISNSYGSYNSDNRDFAHRTSYDSSIESSSVPSDFSNPAH